MRTFGWEVFLNDAGAVSYCGRLCAVMELVIANRTDAGWEISVKEWFVIS